MLCSEHQRRELRRQWQLKVDREARAAKPFYSLFSILPFDCMDHTDAVL